MRQKLLLLAAVFFGILAFMFTYQQISMERKKIQSSTVEVKVIQLKKVLSEGEEITEAHLKPLTVRRSVDRAKSHEIYWDQANQIIGRKVNNMIEEGTILTWYAIDQNTEETGKTGLTARISNNHSFAVGLSVDALSSLNGLIRPNNRVDVIGSFKLPSLKGSELDSVTLTMMQNVRVIACGTDMGDRSASAGNSGRGYSTIVLETTLEQAEMLIFAQKKGQISLVLRRHTDSQLDPVLQQLDWNLFLNRIESGRKESSR